MKSKKIVVLILLMTMLSYLILVFNPITTNESQAARMPAGTLSRDINGIDDNLYPGYKSLIKNMQSKHSNYTFLVYYTGMDWNEILTAEYQGHGKSPKNLFQVGSNYNGMWMCPLCGTKKYDNGSWCCASLEALAYMMDPRVSINDSDIFQFKDLEGADAEYNDIARAVAGYGPYLNNPEAVQAILDASKQYRINAYFLVAKIVNEHGKNGSTLSNGQGYNGKYVGVYNYFNIGSYGNGTSAIINNGLSYAQNKGWTSIRASIFGGTAEVRDSYMNKYSQNTFYYQKFNVSGRSTMASHQYQQNIMAAQSQGSSMKKYYNSTPNVQHTFIIPVFENMPKTVSKRPSLTIQNTITYENGVVQNINTSLTVRAAPNGTAIGKLNNNESIKIIRRATSQVAGYYWDLIVSNVDGTYGYAAREIGGVQHLVATGGNGSSGGTTAPSDPFEGQGGNSDGSTGENTDNTGNEGNTGNINTPVDIEKDIKISGEFIKTIPNVKYEHLKSKYSDVVVKDTSGKNVTAGNIGTGFTVTTGGKNYKVVKKGDTNGDGTVTVVDAVVLLNAVKGTKKLENEFKDAAAVKNETTFNVTDAVYLLNYIKGTSKITV